MTLTKILAGASFWCCLLGLAGIGGAIEFGFGWCASVTLLVIGAVCLYLFCREGGMRG